jgi:hypothetical protein
MRVCFDDDLSRFDLAEIVMRALHICRIVVPPRPKLTKTLSSKLATAAACESPNAAFGTEEAFILLTICSKLSNGRTYLRSIRRGHERDRDPEDQAKEDEEPAAKTGSR